MFRITFTDRPDLEVQTTSMAEAIESLGDPAKTMASCEEFDPETGRVLGGIYLTLNEHGERKFLLRDEWLEEHVWRLTDKGLSEEEIAAEVNEWVMLTIIRIRNYNQSAEM